MSDDASQTEMERKPGGRSSGRLIYLVRYVLPGMVAFAGVVVMCFGGETHLEGGAGILSAGLAIYLINWLFRVGVAGEGERDAEQAAREYYSAHGHWPGEGTPDPPAPSLQGPAKRTARSGQSHGSRLRDVHSRRPS